jgi:hypothetical protein
MKKIALALGLMLLCTAQMALATNPSDAIEIGLDQTITGLAPGAYYKINLDTPGKLSVILEEVPADMLTWIRLDDDAGSVADTRSTTPGELITLNADIANPGSYWIGIIELEGKYHDTPYAFRVTLDPTRLGIMSAETCDWSGNWKSNWGNMVLEQNGNTVTGRYEHDEGRISGTVQGGKLIGRWSEAPSYGPPQDAGDVELVISPGCNSLSGRWRYGNSGDWDGDWTATRERFLM